MAKCNANTKQGARCKRNAIKNSRFCNIHQNREEYQKTISMSSLDEIKTLIKKSTRQSIAFSIITLILSFAIGYGVSTYFYLKSIPVPLEIRHSIDIKEGRLYINVTNKHPFKNSGEVYLYKLELDPNRPAQFKESGIRPRETINYSLTIKAEEINVSYLSNRQPYGFDFTPPTAEIYYAQSHNAITYKITCDNCPSGGYTRRIPCFECVEFNTIINGSGVKAISIYSYRWLDFNLSDIVKK